MLQYYTAKEVAKLLKTSVQPVYRKAKSGELPSEGKRPNIRFPKEAVDTITEIGEEEKPKASQFLFALFLFRNHINWKELTNNGTYR